MLRPFTNCCSEEVCVSSRGTPAATSTVWLMEPMLKVALTCAEVCALMAMPVCT